MTFLSEKIKYVLPALLLILGSVSAVLAQSFPKPMSPPRLVNDYVNLLDQQQLKMLESKLRQYNDTTSTEIAIVIVSTIGQDDIDLYAAEMAQEWGIGKGNKDNGVLMLVAVDDRKVTITTGYGLEGAIPDAYAKRIIEKYITPNFREQKYFEGLDQATSIMMSMASGEFKADPKAAKKGRPSFFLLMILFFFVIMPLISVLRGRKRHMGSKSTGFWTTLLLMSAFGGGRGNSYDDFSSGGGDFGGFGGGGFGGGGASGDW